MYKVAKVLFIVTFLRFYFVVSLNYSNFAHQKQKYII